MPYTTTKEILKNAAENNYAVCAFNAENIEMIRAIISGAGELSAPVIIQTTPSTVKYLGCEYFYAVVKIAAENSKIPVALHLDHGENLDLIKYALDSGYSSVMIDASKEAFEENIEITKKAARLAGGFNIPVEAELGRVGGKEDNIGSEDSESIYTNPDDALEFVNQTGIDSLAVAIGTAHGLYKSTPKLDIDRLSEIKKLVNIPIVLHGATGLPDSLIEECVKRGVNKINFATELRRVYTNAIREKLDSDKTIIDPKIYGAYAGFCVKELVKEKIRLSGSAGRI
ncbi:MAG: class II fructose-bisphosphate aldolase [Oscillospiraceae bacterium]|nr:class II fructose-bisphosphate aldolase [Oscillospiraceae bacterium]